MTEHRDHGDENDNYLKDVRFKSGEMVRHMVALYPSTQDPEALVEGINKLLEWCEWKDIQPMEFGYDTELINDICSVWVKGIQR